MSTENNSELLFKNSIKILTDLISFKTISGEDNTALIDYCDNILKKLGATSFRTYDEEKKRVNLFATLKAKSSNNKKPIILSTGMASKNDIKFEAKMDRAAYSYYSVLLFFARV